MCAAAGARSDGVRLYSACRQKDPLVKCDRHPLERVGRLTDYSVVPHPARDCNYFEGRWRARRPRFPAIGPACSEAFPASGVGKGPGRSNTKRCSRSGSDAETPRGAPADVIQSQLLCLMFSTRFCTLLLPCCRPTAACARCSDAAPTGCSLSLLCRWVHQMQKSVAPGCGARLERRSGRLTAPVARESR